jgi:hypothetical protein
MKTFLEILAAWTALDVVLIAAWHLAHGVSRRSAARFLADKPETQRVVTLAPEPRLGESRPALVVAGRG